MLRSDEAFETMAPQVSPLVLRLAAERFTRREALMKATKPDLRPEQMPDLSDRVHRPVQPVVAAPVQPVHVGQARRGRIGATPAKDAKAASERNRPGGDQLTRI
ncbi:hypothetical protein [Streptomyces viridosporus]|uniref:hypothetical protein n=1 Tax=Streptomyces viridosporus TaxID=67581 RepID=UPI0036FE9239